MKIKELRALLAEFPDEAEVSILLDACGSETEISDIAISWEGPFGEDEAQARRVHLEDIVAQDAPRFDGQIRLGLPDEFHALCSEVEMTPAAVLHGFIADLCGLSPEDGPRSDGLASNGSDEEMLALQYFERCGYRYRTDDRAQCSVPICGPSPT